MLAIVYFFFISNLADVSDVREQLEQRACAEMPAAAFLAFERDAAFFMPLAAIQFLDRGDTAHGAIGWLLLNFEIKLLDDVSSEVKPFLLRDQRHRLPTFAKQLLTGNRGAEISACRELGTDAPRRS